MSRYLVRLLFFVLLPGGLFAQSHFSVLVGSFVSPQAPDFERVRALGFVYAAAQESGLAQVYVGGFSSREPAEQLAARVRQEGFANAAVQERPLASGQSALVIQIATRYVNRPIEWEQLQRAGKLFASLDGDRIRIFTGVYPSPEAARDALPALRNLGFSDAFGKTVNTMELLAITPFETGLKQPLIPLNLGAPSTSITPAAPENNPAATSYETGAVGVRSPAASVAAPVVAPSAALPTIRPRVKRNSALELQRVLKTAGHYQGALDGYYGAGTASAYEAMLTNHRDLRKYRLLARTMDPATQGGVNDALQEAIYQLPTSPAARGEVERANNPIGFAYRAFLLFTTQGASPTVNDLMNQAIQGAYLNKPLATPPPFDYRATYAYRDLNQLVLHLYYIHLAPGNAYAIPCWLAERHPAESARARQATASYAGGVMPMQACDPFLSWEEVRILYTIAADLNDEPTFESAELAYEASQRALLYLATQPLPESEVRATQAWQQKLLSNLDAWATRDPLHLRLTNALKAALFQSQVRLEDYYLDRSFGEEPAKALALATLENLVGYHLERFTD